MQRKDYSQFDSITKPAFGFLAAPISPIIATALLLSGCGATKSSISESVSDRIPHWAGGLPADAPPRPDDPKYAEYLKKIGAKAESAPPKAASSEEIK